MLDVTLRELEKRLAWYLEQVRRGESITIRDHQSVVARIIPPHVPGEDADVPERLRQLVKAGHVVLKPPPRNLPPPLRMVPGEKTAVDFVIEQRR